MEKLFSTNKLINSIFLALLAPTILMNLTTALASFADTVIVGNLLDALALSSVTFATPIYMLINTFAALLAVGGSTAMGIDAGRDETASANRVYSLSLILLTTAGAAIAAVGCFYIDAVVVWLGATGEVAPLVRAYASIVMLGAPLFMLNTAMAFFVRNDGNPNLALAGMLLSIAANILCDLLFIGPFGMGIAGAAYATVLGQLASLVVISTHLLAKRNTLRFVPCFSCSAAVRIVKSGVSTSLHFIYQFVTILFFNHLIVSLAGNDGMVVYTVVFNLSTVALALFEGLSQTVQPMVSVFYGEKNNRALRATMAAAFRATIAICGSVTLLLECFPGAVGAVFGLEGAKLLADAAVAVRIYSLSLVLMTVNVVMGYFYQSIERSRIAAVIVTSRCFVMLLIGAVLLGKLLGIQGIWAGYVFAEVATLAVWMLLVACIRRREQSRGGAALDFLLLDQAEEKDVFDVTIRGDMQALHEVVVAAAAFLRARGVEEERVKKVMLAIDELVANVVMHNRGRRLRTIEVRLTVREDVVLIIRDDGRSFDPTAFEPIVDHSQPGGLGLFLVKSTARFFAYSPTLGFNRVLLKY